MTTTDDRPDLENIADENAILNRLRALREARDAAHAALLAAIDEQRQAGMYWEVINDAAIVCPEWCDAGCTTDPADGSVGHHSALLQVAGPSVSDGELPVAWLAAFASHKSGEVLPEPTFSIHSDVNSYELTADGVRLFAAVLLRQLERITGTPEGDPDTASLAAMLRVYRVPVSDDRGQPAALDGYVPQNR